MKNIIGKHFSWLLLLGLLTWGPGTQAGVADQVQRAKVGPVDVIVYPMDVPDVVTMTGVMPLGDAVVKSRHGQPAVPQLTAMMVQRGTTAHDKYQIADTLSALGAHTSINADAQGVTLYGKSLRKDMPTVVSMLFEQLHRPAFSAEEFAKAKAQLGAMLQQQQDNPMAQAYIGLTGALFGPESPNASVPVKAMLESVHTATLDQVKAFQQRYYGPAHMVLVFTGDVDLAAARRAVKAALDGWSGGVDFLRQAPAAPAAVARTIRTDMRDKPSINVLWGQATGLRSTDAGYLPLEIGVDILGSGFTGRLMSTVRDQEGLTYGIGANLFGSRLVDGGFMVHATFAPQLLAKGVASTAKQLNLWWDKGVSASELKARKRSLLGSHQLSMGTTGGMARALLSAVVRGHDPAWLDGWPQRLDAVTLQQVNQAIRRYLDPATMVHVQAGSLPDA